MRDVNELKSLDDFLKEEGIILRTTSPQEIAEQICSVQPIGPEVWEAAEVLARLSEAGQQMIQRAKETGTFDEEML